MPLLMCDELDLFWLKLARPQKLYMQASSQAGPAISAEGVYMFHKRTLTASEDGLIVRAHPCPERQLHRRSSLCKPSFASNSRVAPGEYRMCLGIF